MFNVPLHIKSDFIDFYDDKSSEHGIVYNRKLSDSMQRGKALKYIRNLGIKTLELKQVSDFSYLDEKLVVYTDPRKHNGMGKKICTYEEAIMTYSNCLASKYIDDTNGITVKYLQIGKRRFNLTFKNNEETLKEGNLIDIKEISQEYNRLIGLPIFSIDYIQHNNEMIATDFNEVQNLSKIGMEKYISTSDIIKEIVDSLIIYNKVERT